MLLWNPRTGLDASPFHLAHGRRPAHCSSILFRQSSAGNYSFPSHRLVVLTSKSFSFSPTKKKSKIHFYFFCSCSEVDFRYVSVFCSSASLAKVYKGLYCCLLALWAARHPRKNEITCGKTILGCTTAPIWPQLSYSLMGSLSASEWRDDALFLPVHQCCKLFISFACEMEVFPLQIHLYPFLGVTFISGTASPNF